MTPLDLGFRQPVPVCPPDSACAVPIHIGTQTSRQAVYLSDRQPLDNLRQGEGRPCTPLTKPPKPSKDTAAPSPGPRAPKEKP